MALMESSTPYSSYLPGTLASFGPAVVKMMRRWNYKEGTGLGARGQGIIAPVQPATQRRHPHAGLGYRDSPYDNGLQDDTAAPLAIEHELCRRFKAISLALELEEDCCNKTIALLRDMITAQGKHDDYAKMEDALAVVVASKKMFERSRRPGSWRARLPSSIRRYVVDQVIKPKMAADVRGWTPSWEADCHHWLRPWIPLVGHLPESLYDAVESKVVARHADEYAVVSPWKELMTPAQWSRFTGRHVLPRLARLVRELRITPPKQVDPSFRTVMAWAPLVPAWKVASILEEELFFDRYEGSLRHWLESAAKPSLAEAVAWCTGWKKLFTPALLANQRVLARLDAVVALVDHHEA